MQKNSLKVRDSEFVSMMFKLTIPVAIQNFISFMVNMVDTVMLGALGQSELSASSLGNQPFFIFMILTYGISGGAIVLCSQYWGKKDVEAIRNIISIAVRVSFIIGLLFSFFAIFFAEGVIKIYTNDENLIEIGASYLRIIGLGYSLYGITNTFLCAIRSIEIVKISVLVNFVTLIINIIINWLLIFGNLGFPEMGIRGAAIATVVARVVEFIIVFIFAFFIDKKLQMKIKYFFSINKHMLKRFFKYSLPVSLNELAWSLGISFQTMIFGRLGAEAVSANSITNIVIQMATVIIFGIANAAAVLVGKAIGENRHDVAKNRSKKLFKISILVGIVGGLIIFFIRDYAVMFYNVPESTKILAKQQMFVACFVVFFQSISATYMIGILRGSGNTKFSFILELIVIWCVSIPFSSLGAFVFKLPIPIVYGMMKIDEVIKPIVCFIKTRGTGWIKDLTQNDK